MIPESIKKVLANVVQHFSESEKALARANIGAAAAEDITTDAVKYTAQTLTDPQKDQARQNIDAAKNALASSSNNGLMSSSDKTKLDGIQAGAEANVQADWNQSDASADDYIKNKPENLVQDADYVHTDNNFTTAEKTKLEGIEAGAEVNVQADWNQTDSTKDDYIKNKPVPVTDVTVDGTSVVSNGVAAIIKDAEVIVYGSTGAWAKLTAAIAANKVVVCRVNVNGNNYREALLSYYNVVSGTAEFNFHRANPNKDYTTQNDEIYIYSLSSNDTWATTQRSVAMKYQAGNGLDKTVTANDSITFLVKPKTDGGITVDSNGVALDPSLKSKLDGIEAGAEVNVQSDWNQTNTSADDYIKNKPSNIVQDASYVHTDNNFTTTLKNKLDGIASGAEVNVQSDWNQSDNTKDDFIKNKPSNLVQDASYVHTDNNFTTTLKNKLDGIASGAEVNVQADWNQTDSTKDDYIKNKPTIAGQVNSNWTASSGVAQILNKPNLRRVVYGGTASELTGLKFDADDPTGYVNVTLDSDQQPSGYLVAGPYKGLLDSGVNGLGDSSEGVYIDSDGTFKKCTKNVVYVSTTTSYADVLAHVNAGREVILRAYPSGNDLFQDFRLSQKNPDGSMEFTCVRSGSGYVISYKYGLNSNGQWTRTDTSVSQYTGVQIDGIGRNLHLNQNNYVQTNFPGGLWTVDIAQDNIFRRLDNGSFNGAFYLAVRYKTDGIYELGLSYSGSGTYSTITFIGTETAIALNNATTIKPAAYINETEYYTVSTRFGGNASTPFDPSSHKAIYYSGFANIGPASDVKIAIWQDNGAIKIGMTCIEIGKVGSTN